MARRAANGRPALEWGVATVPMAGEDTSGDLHVITEFPGGVLVAVVDALGHGPAAAQAATLAIDTLRVRPADPLPELIRRCHQRLIGTRGVVLSLATFDSRT